MSIIKNYQFQFSTSINGHVCVLAFFGAILSFTPCPPCQPESALQKQFTKMLVFVLFLVKYLGPPIFLAGIGGGSRKKEKGFKEKGFPLS